MSTPAVSPPLVAAAPAAAPAAAHVEAPLEIFGVRLIGLTPHVGREILLTIALIVLFLLVNRGLRALNWALFGHKRFARARFWVQQLVAIASTLVLVVGLISIWFENPSKLTTAAGLVSAGVAVALQRVITAMAAYLVILRGKVFNIGDRIMIGSVRGDVVDLGFIRTTVLEMGQAPGEQKDDPSVWVRSRQYTGRLVTVTNDKIFDEPVYNYSRELDFLWEEMHIPIPYNVDWRRAERIVLEAAQSHGRQVREQAREHLEGLRQAYPLEGSSLEPHTFIRLTDNWVDLAVRFVAPTHGSRIVKDRMSREILDRLGEAHIQIASGTYEVVGFPPLRIERVPRGERQAGSGGPQASGGGGAQGSDNGTSRQPKQQQSS